MPAAKLNLEIEQGADFIRTLLFRDNATPTPNPINLTGNTYAGKIRKNVGDTAEVASFSCVIANQTTNAGEMTLSLTASQTALIPLKAQKTPTRVSEQFAYDLEVTYPSGKKERILEGICNVSPEVTR